MWGFKHHPEKEVNTYHTIAAEGSANFKFEGMWLSDSGENPFHVSPNLLAYFT